MRSFTYMDTYLGTNAVGGNITQSEQIEEFIHVKLKGQNLGCVTIMSNLRLMSKRYCPDQIRI